MKSRAARFAVLWSITFHLAIAAACISLVPVLQSSVAPEVGATVTLHLVSPSRSEQISPENTVEKIATPAPSEPVKEPPQAKPKARKIAPPPPKKQKVVREPKEQSVQRVRKEKVSEEKRGGATTVARASLQADAILLQENAKKKRDYRTLVLGMIAKEKRYPSRAQRLGLEGAVTVEITITPQGAVQNSQITESSKYTFFEREVLRMIEAAAPFPPPPAAFNNTPFRLPVPVTFQLQ